MADTYLMMDENTRLELQQKTQDSVQQLLTLQGNKQCADCDELHPKWASTNLCTFICIQCCGVHRSLGTHISKVKSTSLDMWSQEEFSNFVELNSGPAAHYTFEAEQEQRANNERVNAYYEATLSLCPDWHKPTKNSSMAYRKEYITAKYIHLYFTPHLHNRHPTIPAPTIKDTTTAANDGSAVVSPRSRSKSFKFRLKKVIQALSDDASSSSNLGRVIFSGILTVNLKCATNVVAMDVSGTSDPYCLIASGPASSPHTVYPGQTGKSSIQWKTLNPVWNQVLTVSVADLESDVLHLEMWDKDKMSKDDFMGYCRIPLKDVFLTPSVPQQDPSTEHPLSVKLQDVKSGMVHLSLSFISLQ